MQESNVYSGGMKATTIELDGALLRDLNALRRPDQNLTALVRELLKAQIHRSKMVRAADEYTSFLRDNPAELGELDGWNSAFLDREPSRPRRKKVTRGAVI
jgi:hypothetical protein